MSTAETNAASMIRARNAAKVAFPRRGVRCENMRDLGFVVLIGDVDSMEPESAAARIGFDAECTVCPALIIKGDLDFTDQVVGFARALIGEIQ